MEAIIEVNNLTKSFGSGKKKHAVLKGVTFRVLKGQIFSLLGSNGAGKTTIVKILATLTSFDQGSVTIGNYDLTTNKTAIRQLLSLTGQYAAVDQMLTGRENLHLIAKLRHIKNYREITEKLLEKFALTNDGDKILKTYSGGMRRKIDIAMSLLGDPQIIFLDEPTTGLDPQSRVALWEMISELKNQGKTIFLTTQYLEEAERLADYVAVLNHGEIVAQGTPRELKTAFSKLATAEYNQEMPTLEEVFLSIIKGEQR